jgi:hypothetical protein
MQGNQVDVYPRNRSEIKREASEGEKETFSNAERLILSLVEVE